LPHRQGRGAGAGRALLQLLARLMFTMADSDTAWNWTP
jgi:hypothetical protein